MCTQVHPRQVEHDMKEPLNARVYIDGKNRPLFVSTPYETIQGQIQAGAHGLVVTDLSGEVITVPMGRVQSAAQAAPEDLRTVAIEPGVMEGRKVTIRSMGVWRMLTPEQGGPDESERGWFDYPAESVVVIAEDLADAVVLVATEQGEPLWENPAREPGATRRYARAVRLICQAESIEIRAQRADDASDEDQQNGRAHFEAGNVAAAVKLLGPERVAALLAEASFAGSYRITEVDPGPTDDPIDAFLGEIVGFEDDPAGPAQGAFLVDGSYGQRRVGINEIVLIERDES
jgi:hypothetical protein